MRITTVVVLIAMCAVVASAAKKADQRLASAKTAYVVAATDADDDARVAACVSEHLPSSTPLTIAGEKTAADVIFRVKAHLTSGASRVLLGSMGGTPSAQMEALSQDGKTLWSDGAKYRRGNGAIGVAATDPACGLADGLIKNLRDAVHQVVDAKKW